MPRTKYLTGLLVLVVLAGCSGGLGSTDLPQSASTTVEPTQTAESSITATATPDSATAASGQPIAVVNERSVSYRVSFYVMTEENPVLNVSFANGTTVTRVADGSGPLVQGIPFVNRDGSSVEPVRNITAIEPVETPGVAKWSAVAEAESAVSFPLPSQRENVTLLVVVETNATERPLVYTADMHRCDESRPELGEYRLTLLPDLSGVSVELSCG